MIAPRNPAAELAPPPVLATRRIEPSQKARMQRLRAEHDLDVFVARAKQDMIDLRTKIAKDMHALLGLLWFIAVALVGIAVAIWWQS